MSGINLERDFLGMPISRRNVIKGALYLGAAVNAAFGGDFDQKKVAQILSRFPIL